MKRRRFSWPTSLRLSCRLRSAPRMMRGRKITTSCGNHATISTQSQTNRSFCSASINHMPMLRHYDLSRRNQTPRRSPRRLHQPLPIPPALQPTYQFRRLRRTDRLIPPTLRKQFQNRRLKPRIGFTRLVSPARIAAITDHIPVLLPALTPLEGASTGLADLVLMRCSAFGFASAVRHEKKDAGGLGIIHPPRMRILE
jgi:hypothetical protein